MADTRDNSLWGGMGPKNLLHANEATFLTGKSISLFFVDAH